MRPHNYVLWCMYTLVENYIYLRLGSCGLLAHSSSPFINTLIRSTRMKSLQMNLCLDDICLCDQFFFHFTIICDEVLFAPCSTSDFFSPLHTNIYIPHRSFHLFYPWPKVCGYLTISLTDIKSHLQPNKTVSHGWRMESQSPWTLKKIKKTEIFLEICFSNMPACGFVKNTLS